MIKNEVTKYIKAYLLYIKFKILYLILSVFILFYMQLISSL